MISGALTLCTPAPGTLPFRTLARRLLPFGGALASDTLPLGAVARGPLAPGAVVIGQPVSGRPAFGARASGTLAARKLATRLVRSGRAILAAMILCVLSPVPGFAHAILESSTPGSGDSIPAGTVTLELRYNSRIDRARSRLILVGPDQAQAKLVIVPDTAPQILEAAATLGPGEYSVRWQVLAVDGHITRGSFGFNVTGP